jgi:hypothetical protein
MDFAFSPRQEPRREGLVATWTRPAAAAGAETRGAVGRGSRPTPLSGQDTDRFAAQSIIQKETRPAPPARAGDCRPLNRRLRDQSKREEQQ